MMEESKQHFRKIYINHPTYKTPDGFDPVFERSGQRGILKGEHVEIYFQYSDVMYKDGSIFADDENIPGFPFILRSSDENIEWAIDANKICWRRKKESGENWWVVISAETLIYQITGLSFRKGGVVEGEYRLIGEICEIIGLWKPE